MKPDFEFPSQNSFQPFFDKSWSYNHCSRIARFQTLTQHCLFKYPVAKTRCLFPPFSCTVVLTDRATFVALGFHKQAATGRLWERASPLRACPGVQQAPARQVLPQDLLSTAKRAVEPSAAVLALCHLSTCQSIRAFRKSRWKQGLVEVSRSLSRDYPSPSREQTGGKESKWIKTSQYR